MKNCKICNLEIIRNPKYSRKQWDKVSFCSVRCMGISKKGLVPKSVQNKKYLTPRLCLQCKKMFQPKHKYRKNCSLSCYHKSLIGRDTWNKGKTGWTKNTKAGFQKGNRLFAGEKNWNWKGGITPKNAKIRNSLIYKKWRESVFERDNYTCVLCLRKRQSGDRVILNADHVKPFSLYPNLRFNVNNGRTLCVECHKKTDTWGMNQYKNAHTKEILESWQ